MAIKYDIIFAFVKNMIIAIDIVWISNGQVVGVNANVPPPEDLSTSDIDLPQYASPTEVDAVLELAAGQAEALKIDTGSEIK